MVFTLYAVLILMRASMCVVVITTTISDVHCNACAAVKLGSASSDVHL